MCPGPIQGGVVQVEGEEKGEEGEDTAGQQDARARQV